MAPPATGESRTKIATELARIRAEETIIAPAASRSKADVKVVVEVVMTSGSRGTRGALVMQKDDRCSSAG
jgi:hypothetical protein